MSVAFLSPAACTASAICLGSLVVFFRFSLLAMQPACLGIVRATQCLPVGRRRSIKSMLRNMLSNPIVHHAVDRFPADSLTRIAVDETSAVTPSIKMIDGSGGGSSPRVTTTIRSTRPGNCSRSSAPGRRAWTRRQNAPGPGSAGTRARS